MIQSMWEIASNMLVLLACDIAFLAVFIIALIPLSMYGHAAFAVLKRNFVGYFNNPTGYIFLCVFVVLTSLAAFWPHEFFNANLANLDQLNQYIPLIMLVFIPAITMSIWAEERRQGTDELLLTIPADDFSIVLGKYLAAVSIFTASLLFSQISTYLVLVSLSLGEVDTGLFFATYLGYWLLGLSMLAIGMVASFLTNNLTVGFVLGGMFNAPLAAASYADVVVGNNTVARFLEQWSFGQQFEDLGRGVISLSSLVYFILIAVVGVYLCVVLIGRRHWMGGRDGTAMFFHYLIRTVALILIALGANALFTQYDIVRADVTKGSTSSLAADTKKILRNLESEYPIKIEAFISGNVPEQYAQTKKDLISKLKEIKSQASNRIDLMIYDNLETSSEEAIMAEERYGITPRPVQVMERGAPSSDQILLGVAFTSGMEKVVIPFFDYGIPIEYEVIRSIATVGQTERMKIGIVRTDAQLFGGFSMAGGQPRQIPKQPIVEELEKQYEVEEVDPESPIDIEKYRALLVVQPSSLSPAQFDNVLAAIAKGIPTAVFEDPLPIYMQGVPGTTQPKPPQSMFGGPPPEKAEIGPLLDLLGIKMLGGTNKMTRQPQVDVVWQRYMPYPKLRDNNIPPEFVFIRDEAPGASDPNNDEVYGFAPHVKITSGLEEILLPAPAAIKPTGDKPELEFIPLLVTGDQAGTVSLDDINQHQGDQAAMEKARGTSIEGRRFTVAAWIKDQEQESEEKEAPSEEKEAEQPPAENKPSVNVIFVADIDVLASLFVDVRERPPQLVDLRFDNVTLILNMLDALAGDETFLDIRKRKVRHSTLRMVEQQIEAAQQQVEAQEAAYREELEAAKKAAAEEREAQWASVQDRVDAMLQKQQRGQPIDLDEFRRLQQELQIKQGFAQRRYDVKEAQLVRDNQRKLKRISTELEQEVRSIQNGYKLRAVLIPIIPPLLIGLIVFVRRRLREREGVSRTRLK